jgi:hypothetical protein
MNYAYERKPVDATLSSVAVIDARDARKVYATYGSADFEKRLRLMSNRPGPRRSRTARKRLLLIDLTFDRAKTFRRRCCIASSSPARRRRAAARTRCRTITRLRSDDGPQITDRRRAPLSGAGWVSYNGCCGIDGAHRASTQPVNGDLYYAQRFAIDFIRIDQAGMAMKGNEADVASYRAMAPTCARSPTASSSTC